MADRILLHPDKFTWDELTPEHKAYPFSCWHEEPHWRLCCYASNHEAIRLIGEGWELFEDG